MTLQRAAAVLSALALVPGLAAVQGSAQPVSAAASMTRAGSAPVYRAEITRTKHGIPHIFPEEALAEAEQAATEPLSPDHREDLRAAVMIPPFTYCALAVIGGFIGSTTVAGSRVTKEGVALLDALVLRAPVLFIATGAALAIAVVRKLRQP